MKGSLTFPSLYNLTTPPSINIWYHDILTKTTEIRDDDKCNAAGEMDILSGPESPKSGVVIGPLILWLEYEWGDEEEPEDDGQGDTLKVDESTDPTEIEQPNWLFNNDDDGKEAWVSNGA